jgi:RND family efflux transporter MFP subunit
LILPSELVEVSAAVDGLIESVPVDRGDLVEKGQVVAVLEASVEKATQDIARAQSEARALLDSSRTRLEFNDRQLAKNKPLYEAGVISIETLDQVQTDRDLASFALLQAQENHRLAALELRRADAALLLRTILSPIRGVVVERYLGGGELLSRSREGNILKVAQLDPLYVEVLAPVEIFGKVQVGMKADIDPNDPIPGTFTATVKVVDRVIDAASATFGIRLELPNPDYRLPAGLRCQVRFLP